MKNLEEKMSELFQITFSAKDGQIKGWLELKDLNEIVNFIYTNLMSMRKKGKKENKSRTWKKMYREWSYPVQITLFTVSSSISFLKNLYIHETEVPGDFLVILIVLVMIL